jgi:hypothetical protein
VTRLGHVTVYRYQPEDFQNAVLARLGGDFICRFISRHDLRIPCYARSNWRIARGSHDGKRRGLQVPSSLPSGSAGNAFLEVEPASCLIELDIWCYR